MIRSISLPKLISFDNIPPSVRRWIKPMLFLSIGAHAAFFLAPMKETPIPQPKPAEKPRNVVKIAAIPMDRKIAPKPLSIKSSVLARTNPIVVTKPSKYTLPSPAKKMKPANVVAPPKAATQQPAQPPKVAALDPTNVAPANSSATESNEGGSYDPTNPMSDFPQFPGAVAGCLGVPSCYATGKPLGEVSQFFEQQLAAKKYDIKRTVSEADRNVYQVTKGGQTQFLNVLFDGKTALYVLAANALTMKDLQQAVQIPPDFNDNILAQLTTTGNDAATQGTPTPELFANPDAFYLDVGGSGGGLSFDTNPAQKPEVNNMKLAANQTPEQAYQKFFVAQFSQLGYSAKPVAEGYGGGLLYEITKGTFKPFYLNLVPTKNNNGTIVVVWSIKPA